MLFSLLFDLLRESSNLILYLLLLFGLLSSKLDEFLDLVRLGFLLFWDLVLEHLDISFEWAFQVIYFSPYHLVDLFPNINSSILSILLLLLLISILLGKDHLLLLLAILELKVLLIRFSVGCNLVWRGLVKGYGIRRLLVGRLGITCLLKFCPFLKFL
jgi:hypothetical protein